MYWNNPVPAWRPKSQSMRSASWSTLPRTPSLGSQQGIPRVTKGGSSRPSGPAYSPLGPGMPMRKQDPNAPRRMGRPMFAGAYLLEVRNIKSTRLQPLSSQRTKQLQMLRTAQEEAGRETEMLFQLADTNADWSLTFEEFRSLTSKRLPVPKTPAEHEQREAKLKKWYSCLDENGDGVIDPFEYFTFALRECLFRIEHEKEDELRSVMKAKGASKDQSSFNILVFGDLTDKEGHTYVHRTQFAKLASRLGFSEDVGEQVFDKVLVDYLAHLGHRGEKPTWGHKQAIEATFLLRTVHQQTAELRPMLCEWMVGRSQAANASPSEEEKVVVEPFDEATLDQLRGLRDNVHGLLRKLRSIFRADMQRSERIFRAMDNNSSYAINSTEFGAGLRMLGYEAPVELIQALFDELDDDDSYKIGYKEFKTWIQGDDAQFEAQLND